MKDEGCFKWAVIAAFITKRLKRSSVHFEAEAL